MNDRDFKGIWIPKNIWLNKDLSALERVLLSEIDSLCIEEGCTASNKYFAGFLGVSKEWVSRMISNLEKKNYIKVEIQYRKGTKEVERRVITIAPIELENNTLSNDCNRPIEEIDNTLLNNSEIPIEQNFKEITDDNNIYINNINNNKLNNINIYNINNDLRKIVDFYEKNINLVSPTIYEEMKFYLEDGLEADLIIRAIKEAVDRNCKNWKYAKGILNNCKNNKILTLHNYEIDQEHFKNSKTSKNGKKIIDTSQYKEIEIDDKEYAKRLKEATKKRLNGG